MSPDAEAAIDDAEAAFFGLHDRHRRARDRVHVGRDERPLQRDVLREAARQIDGARVAPLEHAVLRPQQEVVEGAAADGVHQTSGGGIHASLMRYRSPACSSVCPCPMPVPTSRRARRVRAPSPRAPLHPARARRRHGPRHAAALGRQARGPRVRRVEPRSGLLASNVSSIQAGLTRRGAMAHQVLFDGREATLTVDRLRGHVYLRRDEREVQLDLLRHRCERPRSRGRMAAPGAPIELPAQLQALATKHGVTVPRISIRNQRSRWGACSPTGTITLNWRLIQVPPFVREYVLHSRADAPAGDESFATILAAGDASLSRVTPTLVAGYARKERHLWSEARLHASPIGVLWVTSAEAQPTPIAGAAQFSSVLRLAATLIRPAVTPSGAIAILEIERVGCRDRRSPHRSAWPTRTLSRKQSNHVDAERPWITAVRPECGRSEWPVSDLIRRTRAPRRYRCNLFSDGSGRSTRCRRVSDAERDLRRAG